VFLIDLNGFKLINDVHGHGMGDETLIVVAQRLQSAMRDGDLVARFGGDEFAILATHLVGPEAATNVALRVIHALEEPVVTGSLQHQVGAGIGIALVPADADSAEEVIRKADVALYRAKAERRSALRFFEDRMDQQIRERDQMEQALRAAMRDGQIAVVFQPTVDLRTHLVVGFEASPRWLHPTMGAIAPERFIPIAEDCGLVHELADRILTEACAAAVHWPSHVVLSADLFPGQLKDAGLRDRIVGILQQSGLPADRLEIEITESMLVRDMDAGQQVLAALRNAGVRVALDNFGTGYSSLYHLRNIKLDKIKIDRSFVEGVGEGAEGASMLRALIGLGHGLGLTVAAEGVTDSQQRASLLGTGVDHGQGLLFSHAVSAEAATALFSKSALLK
jgi:diguanylate cyclase (GGDEF)-like protein